MYEYFEGRLASLEPTQAVVDCGGVGYLLEITLNTYQQLQKADEGRVKLYAHHVVREDAHLLFGFGDLAEREMFRLLIGVNGVGAQTARVMLSSLTVDDLKGAIATQDVRKVQRVKGIGAKTAQRIVLELADKVGGIGVSTVSPMAAQANVARDEALSALVMLGFSKPNVNKALQSILKKTPDAKVEDLIKSALQVL